MDEFFRKDEAEAWSRYLTATRGVDTYRYEEVEPWAWRRLGQALEAARHRLQSRVATDTPVPT